MKIYLQHLSLLAACSAILTFSVAQTKFEKHYGTFFPDDGRYVIPTSDGGYLVAGSMLSTTTYQSSACLLKTNAGGDSVWSKIFTPSGSSGLMCVQSTSDGGYVACGSHGDLVNSDVYIVKTDAGGNTQWEKSYGGSYLDNAYWIEQTTDGGYIVSGSYITVLLGYRQAYVLRLDALGDTLWTRVFNGLAGGDYSEAFAIQQSDNGNFVMCGNYVLSSLSGHSVFMQELDAAGNPVWIKNWVHDTYGQNGYSLCKTPDGGFAFCADKPNTTGSFDYWLIKTDSSGTEQWQKQYRPYGIGGTAHTLAVTPDGGFLLGGVVSFPTTWNPSGWPILYILRTNSNGDSLWSKAISDTAALGNAYCVKSTPDGGYIICGTATKTTYEPAGYGGTDIYLVKTDSSGSFTVGIRRTGGEEDITNIFPNPVSSYITVRAGSDCAGAGLEIFDLPGKLVMQRFLSNAPAENIPLTVPPGIYFYRLVRGKEILRTGKIIIE